MRTLGEVLMIAAAWALVVVALLAGYSPRFDRPFREYLRSGEWSDRPSPYLKFFDEHSARTVFLPLLLILGVGWVLHYYG